MASLASFSARKAFIFPILQCSVSIEGLRPRGTDFAATASLGAATGANAETVGTGKADAAFDKTLGQLIREPGGPLGAIAVVQRGHDVKVFRKGVADQRQRRPSASPTGGGSGASARRSTAPWRCGLLLRKAVALGHDRSTAADTAFAWHNVTLGQLLNHTSGLPNFTKRRLAEGGSGGRCCRPWT